MRRPSTRAAVAALVAGNSRFIVTLTEAKCLPLRTKVNGSNNSLSLRIAGSQSADMALVYEPLFAAAICQRDGQADGSYRRRLTPDRSADRFFYRWRSCVAGLSDT